MRQLKLLLLLLVAAGLALAPRGAAAAAGTAPTEPAAPPAAPATLRVWNHTIAVFRAPLLKVSPAERAARAAQRLENLPADVRPDEVRAQETTLGDLHGVMLIAR